MYRLFFLSLLSFVLYAAPNCTPIPVVGESVEIKSSKPGFILIRNTSMNTLFLTNTKLDASLIEAKKWSLLALNDKSFSLHCVESKPGHEQLLPCEGVVNVCQLKTKAPLPHATAWLSENKVSPSPLP